MKLKEIAKEALKEAGISDIDSGIMKKDNGDGTVSYSITIEFDPDIQKEMAKAMPKGQKREDQADVLDESPKGIFELALDEAISEDDRASRHTNTPLENCRAKDPMYCPYHGHKAIKKWVEVELEKKFAHNTSLLNMTSVSVPPSLGKEITIEIKAPAGYNSAIFTNVLTDLCKKKGVVLLHPISSSYGGNGTPQTHGVSILMPPDYDKYGMLQEWANDLIEDVAGQGQLMNEINPKEFAEFLNKLSNVEIAKNAAGGNLQDPSVVQAVDDAEKAYHMLRGQVEYTGTSLATLEAKEHNDENKQHADKKKYRSDKDEVDAIKKIFWRNGKFPQGFAKTLPCVKRYSDASTAVGYYAQKDYDDAVQAYAGQLFWVKNNGSSDWQMLKGFLGNLDYAVKQYGDTVACYRVCKEELVKELYDWAMKNKGNPNCPTQNDINKAFPNGRPQ